MNTCNECGKGYCPSRVRKVFGHLPHGYCSSGCFTKSIMGKEKPSATKTASEIVDALYEDGYVSDVVAGDPDKFAGAVETVAKFLKEK